MERVASDHVAEILIGIDWLDAQIAIWNMRREHGRVFALKPKMDGGWVRRVVPQELPSRIETNVTGFRMYRDISSAWETWASKPGSSMGEICVARTLVPNRCRDVQVWVMNLARYPLP